MISQQTIQQITSRIDIIDIVGEFIKLKKRGTNYLGLCPFHNEKTPSFTISPSKEIYKCFGCGKSGNTISFLMEHEKYSYVEALKWLANRYNVEVEETEVSNEQKLQQQVADSLYIVNSFAQKFFSEQLYTEEGNAYALSYLEERGFKKEIIEKFQLGYNPNQWTAFTQAALKNQFNKELLLKSGLVVQRNEELSDNYRDRIIFPVHSNTGKIVGFGARIIGKIDKAPKYINTPENDIYIKSRILYGSYFARHAIDKNDECLLVEGYTDVISLHQAGIENVVASGGTSLTIDQLRIIRKYTNNLTIIYDGDNAGIKAALRGLDMALEEGLNVKLVLIPDKEDPDSYVNKVGTQTFNNFITSTKKDFILFQLEVLLAEAGNDVNKKNEVVNHMAETLSKISKAKDFYKRQEYVRQCSSILNISESGLTNLVNEYTKERISKEQKPIDINEKHLFQQASGNTQEEVLNEAIHLLLESQYQEREIIKRLIEYGNIAWDDKKSIGDTILEVLNDYHVSDDMLDKVVTHYIEFCKQHQHIDPKSFLYTEDISFNNFVAGLLHFPYELADWNKKIEGYHIKIDKDVNQVINSALTFYKMRKIKLMLAQLQDELRNSKDDKTYKITIDIYLNLKSIEKTLADSMNTVIYY